MARRIEKYKEIVETTQHHAPISKLIGMKMVGIDEGKAIFELPIQDDFLNSINTVQGGVISIMADAAMGIAFGSLLDEDENFSTIEFKINFFRPVSSGILKAIGRVTQKGKRTGYTECEIFNKDNKKVAKAVGTCIII